MELQVAVLAVTTLTGLAVTVPSGQALAIPTRSSNVKKSGRYQVVPRRFCLPLTVS